MDRQKVFDQAATGLLKQGKPAITHGDCRYRTESGLRCAVGQLFPADVTYLTRKDNGAKAPLAFVFGDVRQLLTHYTEPCEWLEITDDSLVADASFLQRLQEVHDLNPSVNWTHAFRDFAHEHGLSTKVLPLKIETPKGWE